MLSGVYETVQLGRVGPLDLGIIILLSGRVSLIRKVALTGEREGVKILMFTWIEEPFFKWRLPCGRRI